MSGAPKPLTEEQRIESDLEAAFHRAKGLLDSDEGCEHEDEFMCWRCTQRIYVLTTLPVVMRAVRRVRKETRDALIQARGALRLDVMVDDDGKPFGTTVVAMEAIDAALAKASGVAPPADEQEGSR